MRSSGSKRWHRQVRPLKRYCVCAALPGVLIGRGIRFFAQISKSIEAPGFTIDDVLDQELASALPGLSPWQGGAMYQHHERTVENLRARFALDPQADFGVHNRSSCPTFQVSAREGRSSSLDVDRTRSAVLNCVVSAPWRTVLASASKRDPLRCDVAGQVRGFSRSASAAIGTASPSTPARA